jgi:GH3 auxin-responsive promoter
MANPLMSLLSVITARSRAGFSQKTRQIDEVQEQFLRSLLHAHQGTVLGQEYQLSEIQTIDQFRERIPIRPYSAYEPYIQRIAQGEPNVLTPDPVVYLNLTSGSTGKQKLIPVTVRSRRAIAHAKQASMGFTFAAAQKWNVPLGRMLLTSSMQLLGHTSSGIPYGPVSVGDLRQTNFAYRKVLAHPFEAMQIADSLTRHYICLLFALRNPVGIIGANFPILGLRLCDYLESYADDLIRDLETGTIADWLKLEPELRVILERQWSAHPRRARELRDRLKSEGRLTPKLAWENLSLIITARGGTSNFYFERFPAYFGDTPVFGGVYASAESTFGIYHDFNNDGSILAIESGFFEFIPEEQWDEEQPKTLMPCEVEVGKYYRLLVTNYNGFYRYDIGDVVEILGFYEQTPLVVFRHRLGGLLSSTTEKTTEFHVIQVMQRLQKEFNLSLENFCITLSDNGAPSHYLVNVELAPGHTLDNPQHFLHQFDHHLKDIHVSYAVKRREQVPDPRLRILETGSFAQFRQRLMQKGIPESHLKFPHISEDRQLLAGLSIQQEISMS